MTISNRLLLCADFVAPGDRVADIGCDHGYLGIHLLQKGIAKAVIASDINEMPLKSAIKNAEKYGVKDQMSFYLSDGVQNIPRDFDTLICAGMGGDTMVSILTAAPWLKSESYRLILQCQSKTPLLRRYLSDNGFLIARESLARDGKFLYTVMEVIYQPGTILTPGQWYISPALAEDNAPELGEYRDRIVEGLALSVQHKDDPVLAQALKELKEDSHDND